MPVIASDIQTEIERRLAGIERDENVRILYACESGSRAWGFESQDSDYDVRFIYVRPHDWYLTIDLERRRDVIELPINDDLDVNGWDVRKSLQLFRKTNPPLIEWLFSPVVYLQHGSFTDRMRQLAPDVYNFISARYHYFHMAAGNFREYLKGESVLRKKYLYVLRPLLAVNWIENDLGIVPTEFDRLVAETVTDAELKSGINELLRIKRSGRVGVTGTLVRYSASAATTRCTRLRNRSTYPASTMVSTAKCAGLSMRRMTDFYVSRPHESVHPYRTRLRLRP